MSLAHIIGVIALGVMAIMGIMAISVTAATTSTDISDLKRIVSSFDDPPINPSDLAFFLATHNYDAVPNDGYVELDLNGRIYGLVPNGKEPGLCDITG